MEDDEGRRVPDQARVFLERGTDRRLGFDSSVSVGKVRRREEIGKVRRSREIAAGLPQMPVGKRESLKSVQADEQGEERTEGRFGQAGRGQWGRAYPQQASRRTGPRAGGGACSVTGSRRARGATRLQ